MLAEGPEGGVRRADAVELECHPTRSMMMCEQAVMIDVNLAGASGGSSVCGIERDPLEIGTC